MNLSPGGRVVVGVGESLSALQALRSAVAEARRRGTELCAVRVWHVHTHPDAVSFYSGRVDAGAHAAETIRRSFDRAMGGLPRDLSFELIAVEGAVGPTLIAQVSSDEDLLVIGAPVRRWWSPSRFSLVKYCTRTAACPVLIVPAPTLARTHSIKASARAIEREVERLVNRGGSA